MGDGANIGVTESTALSVNACDRPNACDGVNGAADSAATVAGPLPDGLRTGEGVNIALGVKDAVPVNCGDGENGADTGKVPLGVSGAVDSNGDDGVNGEVDGRLSVEVNDCVSAKSADGAARAEPSKTTVTGMGVDCAKIDEAVAGGIAVAASVSSGEAGSEVAVRGVGLCVAADV
jgi:hypothetical protein